MSKIKESVQPGSKLIAISGASGKLGNLFVRRLHRLHKIIAIDSRDFTNRPADVLFSQAELSSKKTGNQFRRRKIDTVIHIETSTASGDTNPRFFAKAIKNYARLLEYCDRYNVKKLILLSSSNLYGALPTNSQFLKEESPLLSAQMSVLRTIDMMTQSFFWKRPDIETVILRPTHITGAVNGLFSRYLRLQTVPVLLGFNPMIQMIHEEDVVTAVTLALKDNVRGIFNIAGPEPVPLRRIIKTLGRKTIEIPHPVAKPFLRHLTKLNVVRNMSPSHINYLRYVCMVDDTRARKELNYHPQYSLSQTITAVDLWQ